MTVLQTYKIQFVRDRDLGIHRWAKQFLFLWRFVSIPGHSHPLRGFVITLFRRTTLGGTPLGEWSAWPREICLTTHKRKTFMPAAVFEIIIPSTDWSQTHTLRHHGRHFEWYLRHPPILTPLQGSSVIYNTSQIQSPFPFQTSSIVTWLWPPSWLLSCDLTSRRVARKFKLHCVFTTVIVRYICDILLSYVTNGVAIFLFTTSPIFFMLCHAAFVKWGSVSAFWPLPRDQIRWYVLCRVNWHNLIWSGMS